MCGPQDTYTQKADPYLVVHVSGLPAQKTAVCKNTLKPVWNETMTFEDVAAGEQVHVELFDHEKMGEDRSMGSFAVGIREGQEGLQEAFALQGTLFDKRPAAGTVYLALAFHAAPLPARPEPDVVKERGELAVGAEPASAAAATTAPPPPSPPRHVSTKEEEMYIEAITKQEHGSQASPSDVTDTTDWAAVHAELLQMVSREDKRAASKRLVKSRHTIPWEECPAHMNKHWRQGIADINQGWETARSRALSGGAATPRTSASLTPRMTGVSFSRRQYMYSGKPARLGAGMGSNDPDDDDDGPPSPRPGNGRDWRDWRACRRQGGACEGGRLDAIGSLPLARLHARSLARSLRRGKQAWRTQEPPPPTFCIRTRAHASAPTLPARRVAATAAARSSRRRACALLRGRRCSRPEQQDSKGIPAK